MTRTFKRAALLGALALAFSSPVHADTAPAPSSVTLTSEVMLVKESIAEDGTKATHLVAPNTVVPGDRLIFGIGYENTSDEAVSDFELVNPLPTAVYLANDAGADLIVSVDGGKVWGTLAQLTVTDSGGSTQPAQSSDVTHIRWTLQTISPGESGRLEYPVVVK